MSKQKENDNPVLRRWEAGAQKHGGYGKSMQKEVIKWLTKGGVQQTEENSKPIEDLLSLVGRLGENFDEERAKQASIAEQPRAEQMQASEDAIKTQQAKVSKTLTKQPISQGIMHAFATNSEEVDDHLAFEVITECLKHPNLSDQNFVDWFIKSEPGSDADFCAQYDEYFVGLQL